LFAIPLGDILPPDIIAQYTNFEEFIALYFNALGNPRLTPPPPPTYTAQPPAAHKAIGVGYETLLEAPMPSISTTQPPAFYGPAIEERNRRAYKRLIIMERMVQWVYDN
jgi:hypothetical protein